MDYPVLVNTGKPLAIRMKKKTTSSPAAAERGGAGPSARLGATSAAAGPKRAKAGPKDRAKADPKPPPSVDTALAMRRLRRQLAEAEATIAELRASADTDFLLGVLNRRGFERELKRSIAFIQRYEASGALLVLDVDGLKPINDTFGHAAGDEVLKAIVGVLQRYSRASDLVGRLGGDEFVLMLWNCTEASAQAKARLLEDAIDALRFTFHGDVVSAGASTGIAMLAPDTDAVDTLAQADRAMYARKAARKSTAAC
jgi:diguanylate cyclase (GGDEF)-like protein